MDLKPHINSVRISARSLMALLALSVVVFTGCGSSSSSSGSATGTSDGSTISGVVIDGYWRGAKVCIDRNQNAVCDSDEPSATSGSGGKYSIAAKQTDTGNYSLVAEGTTETFDEGTNSYLTGNIVLMSPAGMQNIITPITTMIETEIRYNGKTLSEAKSSVAAALNISEDALSEDYVASGNTNLENNATKIAQELQENDNDFEKVAEEQGVTTPAGGEGVTEVSNKQVNFNSCQNDSSITTTNNKVYSFFSSGSLAVVNENLTTPCSWTQASGSKTVDINCSDGSTTTFTIDSSLEVNKTVALNYGSSSDLCTIDTVEEIQTNATVYGISSTYPASNATDVPPYAFIDINFIGIEPEKIGFNKDSIQISGNKTCKEVDFNNTLMRCWVYNGQLGDAFDENTVYSVSIAGAVLTDGNTTTQTFSFTTGKANVLPRLRTGQTTSYSDYDDGWYVTKGLGLERTFSRANDIVTDNATGLMWQDDSASASAIYSWSDANTTCENLTLGGYSDWKLPKIDAMITLANRETSPAVFGGLNGFQYDDGISSYWSSSIWMLDKSYIWDFGQNYGNSYHIDPDNYTMYSFLTRCVKNNQTIASNYLRDDKNDIVLDTSSGLIWQDDSEAAINTSSWDNAISYCNNLSLGGYSDWRLPNVNEFLFLADRSKSNPAVSEKFKNIQSSYYWSSTTAVYAFDNMALYVRFDDGSDRETWKSDETIHIRCVRGGVN